jgi:biopolymer transport protein ExbD
MSRRKKKKHGEEEVTLNLAAMLDMAFQLLTFFILTFRPAPVEGQVALRLPPPQAIAAKNPANAKKAGQDPNDTSPVKGVNTLIITVFAKRDGANKGKMEEMAVGEARIGSIPRLNDKLKEVFADPGNPFDQVIVQVSDELRYDELMRVVEVCTHQTLPDGNKLTKLSFVDLGDSQGQP